MFVKYFAFSALLFAYGSSVWATPTTVNSHRRCRAGQLHQYVHLARCSHRRGGKRRQRLTLALSLPNTITLSQGELVIGKSVTVQGPGAAQLAISASFTSRVLNVSGGSVAMIGLTVSRW